jgi:hypothetical protein
MHGKTIATASIRDAHAQVSAAAYRNLLKACTDGVGSKVETILLAHEFSRQSIDNARAIAEKYRKQIKTEGNAQRGISASINMIAGCVCYQTDMLPLMGIFVVPALVHTIAVTCVNVDNDNVCRVLEREQHTFVRNEKNSSLTSESERQTDAPRSVDEHTQRK